MSPFEFEASLEVLGFGFGEGVVEVDTLNLKTYRGVPETTRATHIIVLRDGLSKVMLDLTHVVSVQEARVRES